MSSVLHPSRPNRAAWGRLTEHGIQAATLEALDQFIGRAADHELYQANPRYWAERLDLDEQTTLALIVAGVAEGLFDLNWQTICPVCKHYSRPVQTLGTVAERRHCAQCGHKYDAHLDDEVLVTVSVSAALRPLSPTQRDDLDFRAAIDARHGMVSALALINTPGFQELATQRTLPEGQSLGVKRLAIFFSDLRSSTAFYHKYGDAAAYRHVCEHFKVVFAAVARHHGTAVKTIGDGVMGVFADPLDALRSLAETQVGLADLNDRAGLPVEDRLVLKAGLHLGPCVVVTLNGRLDYFGETVNIAARLSALSAGNDLVLSHAFLADAAACALAEELGQLRPLAANLRGLPEAFELHRLIFAPPEVHDDQH